MRYTEIYKEAERLHKLGFGVHWLHAKSKRPVDAGWGTGPRKPWKYLAETYQAGLNLGVRLGEASQFKNGFLAVVDVDVKGSELRHKREALAAAKELLIKAGLPEDALSSIPTVLSGRGGGSRHFYCISPTNFKTWNPAHSNEIVKFSQPSKGRPSKREIEQLTDKELAAGIRLGAAWEISLYCYGRQCVLPPSVHPDSGELYAWKVGIEKLSALPVLRFVGESAGQDEKNALTGVGDQQARMSFKDGASGAGGQFHGSDREAIGSSERSEDATREPFEFNIEPVDLAWLPISKEVKSGIVSGEGVTDRSGFLLKASSALLSAGLTQNEVLTVLTDPKTFLGAVGYDHAKTKNRARAAAWVFKYTFKKVAQERSAAGIFGKADNLPPARKLSPEEQEAQALDIEADRNWRQDLDKNQHGKTRVSLKNLDLIFTNAIGGQLFVKDLFANRVKYGVDTPWGRPENQDLEDIDLILVKRWLASTEFGIEPPTSAILEATSLIGHRRRIHPVRDWLDSLKWDGVPRLNTWIKDYCQGYAAEPYLSEVSRKFILAMVKRVFEPGCQWDYVLVLEGKQGRYKSSIARALASDKWFMDNLPDLKDKDAMLNLQGKWLIELGELTNVKRSDHNLVKAYLVRRTDTVRPHYGRLMSDVPRQSVFIGTVNEGQYLKDPTGNRRFWPVKVGTCNVKALSAVRDQLFAEAMHIYRGVNEVLMLGPAATVQAEEAQEDRRVDDDETAMHDEFVNFLESKKSEDFNERRFKIRELFYGADAPWSNWAGKGYAMNVAASVLLNLGFARKKLGGQRVWGRVENHDAEDAEKQLLNMGHHSGAPPGASKVMPHPPRRDFF